MPKIVNTSIKAKAKAWTFEAKAIKFGLEAPRGQGLASRTTSLVSSLVMLWWLMKGCIGQRFATSVMLLFGLQNFACEKSWKLVEISLTTLF